MVSREPMINIIYIGRLSLTGKQTKKGKKIILVEPKAVAALNFENPMRYNPPPAVGEANFAISCDYREATTNEDVAYFSATLLDEDGNVIDKAEANSKDTYGKYNYFGKILKLKENFEKYYRNAPITLKRKILIECFLKTKNWKKESNWEIKTKDSKVSDIKINLERPEYPRWPVPEVSVEVQPDRFSGNNCPKNCACVDIGRFYNFTAWIKNNGEAEIIGNKIILSGGSAAFPIVTRLPKQIPPHETLGIADKNCTFSWNWQWWSDPESDTLGYISWVIAPTIFSYKIGWDLIDKNGYKYSGDKLQCVQVIIPQAKIKAAESYNKVVEAVWTYELLSVFGFVVGLAAEAELTLVKIAEHFGIERAAGVAIEEYANKIKDGLLKTMQDPPTFTKNYKILQKIRTENFSTLVSSFAKIQNQFYSAKKLGKSTKRHNKLYKKCKTLLFERIKLHSKQFLSASRAAKKLPKITQADADIITAALKNKRNKKLINTNIKKLSIMNVNLILEFLGRTNYPIDLSKKFGEVSKSLKLFSREFRKWNL